MITPEYAQVLLNITKLVDIKGADAKIVSNIQNELEAIINVPAEVPAA
jgi:hypothetical protein